MYINGRLINYKYIIATNSFLSQSSVWKRIVLCYTYMIVNKV